jgi:hypothetical protein
MQDVDELLVNVHTLKDGKPEWFSWKKVEIEDHRPVLDQNYIDQCNSNNGFTEKRMFRHLARIPVAVINAAKENGYDMNRDGDLMAFLSAHPQYMTVKKRLSQKNGDGRIIVK